MPRSTARWSLPLFILAMCALAHGGTTPLISAGAIGDSLAAEYQFSGPPDSSARNFVELLAENNRVNFGAFSTTSLGTPRLQGYANNWAVSSATTADLTPQTAGLAQQAATGKVQLAFVNVGANDIRTLLSGADPTTTVTNGITNTVTAVQTLLAVNPQLHVAVANVPDITKVPGAQALLAADPALASLFTQASALINTYNTSLAAQFAGNSRVAIVDENGLFNNILAHPSTVIPGVTLNTTTPGTSPDHLFIDALHPGTLGQGLLANAFVNSVDSQFQLNIAPLTNAQIEASASGAASVPLPSAAWAMLLVLPLVLWGRKAWSAC